MQKRGRKTGLVDKQILFLTITLVLFGIVMVFSASYVESMLKYHGDAAWLVRKNIYFAVVGGIAMYIASHVSYRFFENPVIIFLFLLVTAITYALLETPLGVTINDSKRWIYLIGRRVSFQPSELAKFACIFVTAKLATVYRSRIGNLLMVLLIMLIPGIFAALTYKQPNMSTAVVILLSSLFVLFVAGLRPFHILFFGASGLVGVIVMIRHASYRMGRFTAFLNPESSPQKGTYQILQSLYAIASGGFTGTGLGEGRQKYLFLPEIENDYIFSQIAEELGYIGAIAVILLFVLLIIRIFKLSKNAPSYYSSLVTAGIGGLMMFQLLINVAVATSSMPSTGIALPFVSYGGTSLIIFMVMMGLILNISRYDRSVRLTQEEKRERDRGAGMEENQKAPQRKRRLSNSTL